MKPYAKISFVLAVAFSIAAIASASGELSVGLPAPAIKVARWVKGTPVTNFEKGKVYVVEFWATWCGPCKMSIPHLTELAKKYAGKVTFTGVSVYEKNGPLGEYSNYGDKVDAFVKEWGDKMNYNVCWDGDQATMAHTWMEAAKQNGIPTAFVVNRDGQIAWIGHPMAGLDETIQKVLDGTFDVKAEAEKQRQRVAAQEAQMKAVASYSKPFRAGDYKGVVAAIDALVASDPKSEGNLGVTRFIALSNYDAPTANAYALKLANGAYKGQSAMLNSLAWAMVEDGSKVKSADYKVAVQIADMCIAATTSGDAEMAMNLDTQAACYAKDGQLDKAISIEEQALKDADSAKGFDAATRKEMADRLDALKKQKGQ